MGCYVRLHALLPAATAARRTFSWALWSFQPEVVLVHKTLDRRLPHFTWMQRSWPVSPAPPWWLSVVWTVVSWGEEPPFSAHGSGCCSDFARTLRRAKELVSSAYPHQTAFNVFWNQWSSLPPPDSTSLAFSSDFLYWKSSVSFPRPVASAACLTGLSDTTLLLMQRTQWWISSDLMLCEIKMSPLSTETPEKMQKALACNTTVRCPTAEIRGLMPLPYHFYVT